jgi:hypothetical protein
MHAFTFDNQAGIFLEISIRRKRHPVIFQVVRRVPHVFLLSGVTETEFPIPFDQLPHKINKLVR